MMSFADHVDGHVELAVCMTDTLMHLESVDQIRLLCTQLKQHLEVGGRFIATFRDPSTPLKDGDWHFSKSCYYKLTVTPAQVRACLLEAGFRDVTAAVDNGLATIVATS